MSFLLISVFIMFTGGAHASTCGTGVATSFGYPLEDWSESCGFDTTCAAAHHMGIDGVPASGTTIGTAVIAPCSGLVKEAASHSGYGGMVIMECWTGDECVSPFMAHMYASTLTVAAGDSVTIGDTVGYLADSSNNGGWSPHVHFGIRLGGYDSYNYTDCYRDPVWSYSGYPYDCYSEILADMYDPDDFIADNLVTCTTETHSINLVTAEASGSAYNLNGYAAYDTGDSAYLDGAGALQSATGSTSGHKFWLVGNVNGDSWDDVVEITDSGGYTYAYVYTSNGIGGLNSRASWVKTTSGVISAFLGNMDGDTAGKADLILGYANSDGTAKWKKYTSTGSSFGGTTSGTIWSSTFGKSADTFIIGDFDNDNKAELLDGRESSGSNDGDFDYTLTWKRLSNTGSASTVYTGYGYSGDQFIAVDFDSDNDDDLIRIDLADSNVSISVAKYSGSSFTTPSVRVTDVGGEDGQYYFYPLDYIDNYPDLLRVHDDPDVPGETSDALSMSCSGAGTTTAPPTDCSGYSGTGTLAWEAQSDQDDLLTGMTPDIDYLFGYFGDYDVEVCE